MTDPHLVETTEPDDAFGALADEIRVDILQALWRHPDGGATFSELREAVGVADSGKFNYHLGKLTDRFVRKTGDTYELTLAGRQVNGAIHGGAFTMEGSLDPIELAAPCPACGGARTFRYTDETVSVDCDGCPTTITAGVPPAVFAGHDRTALPAVAARYFRTIFQHLENGFCWYCDGPVSTTVLPATEVGSVEAEMPEEMAGLPLVEYQCQRCGADVVGDLGAVHHDHPAVVAFHYDHGIDVRDQPLWKLSAWTTDRARFRERAPVRAAVTYEQADDTLTLVVDGDGEVCSVEPDAR